MSSTTLRPEARSVPWRQLDGAQREAMGRMIALLNAALNDLHVQKERHELGPGLVLDSDRSSRNVFLSGERGTGKTTVLLSLREACYWAKLDKTPAGYLDADDPAVEKILKNLWTTLREFASRLVWLEPIDMEPLPASTNLLGAILARIDKAVKPDETSSGSGSREAGAGHTAFGLLDPSPDYQQALMALQVLMTSVALAWDGNISQRAGSVDPDTYAVEVMRAEQARLSLNQKMNQVLDQLARKVFDRGGTLDPLFVLPVDDFDLNPPRSLDLLRLLRAISVPRLFNIVLGDLRVAEVVFNLSLSSAFVDVAKDPHCCDLLAIQPDTIQRIATELAANAIRKLIPPSQAIRLELMSIAETLLYRPIASAANEARLYQILERCPLDLAILALPGLKDSVKAEVANLYAFLLGGPSGRPGTPVVSPLPQPAPSAGGAVNAPAAPEKDGKTLEAEVKNSPYSAKAFLKMTPRRAADLWLSLQEILRRRSATEVGQIGPTVLDEFLEVLVEASRKAVNEDIFLKTLERQALQRAFGLGEGNEWELDSHAYEEEPKVGPAISIALSRKEISSHHSPSPEVKTAQARQVVYVSQGKGWRLWGRGRQGENPDLSRQRGTAPPMEDATASLIMLLQDILILRPNGRWLGRQLMPSLPVLKQWGVTEWRVDYWLKTTVTWPTPIWATFWEYDRFLGRWNRARVSIPNTTGIDENAKLRYLVYVWIETATAVLAWDELPDLPHLSPMTKLDWKVLADRVGALLSGMGGDVLVDDRVRYWVLDVAYMLLPEVTGIGDEVIAHFTSSTVLRDFWFNQVEEMRSYRLRVLRWRFADIGMLDLANDLGGRVPAGLPLRLAVQLIFSYQDDRSGSYIDAEDARPTPPSTGR